MLEILFLRWFYRHLADVAESKAQPRAWGLLGVAAWIVGEVIGFATAFGAGATEIGAYGMALALATLGAIIGYGAVRALPDQSAQDTGPVQF